MPAEIVSEPLTKYGLKANQLELDYLTSTQRRGVEFTHGILEFLPVPSNSHQAIFEFLFEVLKAFVVAGHLGKVRSSGIRVKIAEGVYREPDLVFVLTEHMSWIGEKCWEGVDLVMEIVSSPEGRARDLIDKRAEYAAAKFEEYWIIDPLLHVSPC